MLSVLRVAGLAALLAVSGCSSSIHNSRTLSKPGIDFVDARQRAVVSTKAKLAAGDDPERMITCSEPSPDVFSVLAASFGLDLGLAPSSASDTAKISAALSENAATIQRTQTINLLRESLFRTCERYLNGAIGPAEMIVQSARDQRAMVSILAIEQLTGSLTPPPVVISSSAIANANDSAAQVIQSLQSAKTASDAAAAKALADENKAKATYETNKCKDIEATAEGARTDTQNASLNACNTDKATAAASKASAVSAKEYYDAVRTYVANASPEGVAARGGGELLGDAPKQPTAADRAAVASAVSEIVRSAYAVDEYTMFCIRTLYDQRTNPADPLYEACIKSLEAGLLDEAAVRTARAGVEPALQMRVSQTNQLFEPVSMLFEKSEDFSKTLKSLETEAAKANSALIGKSLFNAKSISEARKSFVTLGDEEAAQVSDAARALLER